MHAFILFALSATLTAGSSVLIVSAARRAYTSPRPDDASVTAVSPIVDRPGDGQTVVTAAIANSGSAPVLVGLSLRRKLLPGGRTRTTAARRTSRRRYHASRHVVVAAVPDGGITRLSVPVPGHRRRYRLVAVIGQLDGRLCVTSVPVTIPWYDLAAVPYVTTRQQLFPWQRWLEFYDYGSFWPL
ncbi:MAG TPA: hypothetical protein VMG13_13315 [Trebonia sp.]|nr:hypothetical protein [Trebonia sp.]